MLAKGREVKIAEPVPGGARMMPTPVSPYTCPVTHFTASLPAYFTACASELTCNVICLQASTRGGLPGVIWLA